MGAFNNHRESEQNADTEKQEIFSIRNKMVNIPANFGTINVYYVEI